MKKKIISSIMCLAMLLSLLPVSAFATAGSEETDSTPVPAATDDGGSGTDGSGTTPETPTETDVIIAAFGSDNVTKEGSTYTLTKDVTLSNRIELTADSEVTIDLNNHSITGAQDSGVFWVQNGSLTLTGTGTITTKSKKSAGIWAMAGCKALTIDKGVTITSTDTDGYAIAVWSNTTAKPSITIKGTLSGQNVLTVNGDVSSDKAPTIKVDGATITAKDVALYLAGPANTTVTGSKITSENVGIEIRAGVLYVSGNSTVTSTGTGTTTVSTNGDGSTTKNAAIAVSQHTTDKPINVTIDSATLKGTTALVAANPEDAGSAPADSAAIGVAVKDSTLTGDVVNAISKPSSSDTVANSGVSISGGTVTGTVKDATIDAQGALTVDSNKTGNASSVTLDKVSSNGSTLDNLTNCTASVNGVRYDTFAAAVAAAKTIDNAVVTLYQDVELSSGITLDKSITINGNGHTVKAAASITGATRAMIQVAAAQGADTNPMLTLRNVTLDANGKSRVIYCGSGDLTIEAGTKITGGVSPKDSYIGGVFVSGGKLIMNGGEISGNKIDGKYASDGYLQYSADLWIGDLAEASITGGKVGTAFLNANNLDYAGIADRGGKLEMTGGSIDTAFVEAENDHTANVAHVKNDAVINDTLVAMDYAYDEESTDARVVVSLGQVTGTEAGVAIKGLEVPAGATATVVTTGTESTSASYTLTNNITIGAGAILTVPENTTVNVKKGDGAGAIPTITNNGTLIVDGALLAGTSDSDSDYLNFAGSGAVSGSGTIDVDPNATETATVKLDAAGGTGVDAEYTVIITGAKATFTLPIPTRSGYEFQGWKDSTGEIVTSVELEADDEVSFTAQWKQIGGGNTGGGGGGGGVSSNVTVSSATNGKVTVTPTAPSKGATVTINLTPDAGYQVGSVTVTDKDGNTVELTKVNDTQYTFTMPDGKVTVRATFTQVEAPSSTSFTDVTASAYYADAVKWAVEQGITNGLTATTFGPDNSCTRGQMVTFLWRAAGSPAATGTNSFSDVASGEYYYDAVLWAVEKGITNGTSDTTFSPNATVTRGQTVTFLYRYAGSPAVSGDSSFADVASSDFYANAVAWAVAEEITNGTSTTTFSPASNCTRGQIVTFMYRQMAE